MFRCTKIMHSAHHQSQGNTGVIGKRIQPEILRRKKEFFRWNTLCISRKNNAFPAEKIGCSPKTHCFGVALKLLTFDDLRAAQHLVALIEHNGLSRSHRPLRDLKIRQNVPFPRKCRVAGWIFP